MIQEDYVTFEQAKLLKEKGFPQEWYHQNVYPTGEYDSSKFNEPRVGELYFGDAEECYWAEFNKWISAPTLSLVQKWLREEKNIDIDISCNKGVTYKYYDCYIHEIADFICDKEDNPIKFNTYKEALSEGINKALELI